MADSLIALPRMDDFTRNCSFYLYAKEVIQFSKVSTSTASPITINVDPFTYAILHITYLGDGPSTNKYIGVPNILGPDISDATAWYYDNNTIDVIDFIRIAVTSRIASISFSNARYVAAGFLYIIE